MPTQGRSQIVSHPTPLIRDVLFYEIQDISKERWSDLNYGDPHYDADKWPHHELVDLQALPDKGDNIYVLFYAAKRKYQDRYNWEHTKANLGGNKFDVVTRSYVVKRDDYSETTPALGTVMPDVPTGKFTAANYHLISRNQDRISQRSARAESTVGQAELDSLYVVEIRTYIDREEISRSSFDAETGGTVFTRQNIYIRGETYPGTGGLIEDADDSATNWGVSATGQLDSVEQISDDVWVVTTQDLLPQNLSTTGSIWGGIVVRRFMTTANYAWPAVMGSDGVPEATGNLAVEIMNWEDKDGNDRNYVRPRYKRHAKRKKTMARFHQEWITQTQMDAYLDSGGALDVIDDLDPKPIYYPSPYLTVNLPPSLHRATGLTCNTAATDPTWGLNTGSTRNFPATDNVDWPTSIVADVQISPWRHGYLVTHVTIFSPEN